MTKIVSILTALIFFFATNLAIAKNLSIFKLTPDLVFHSDHLYEINLKTSREFSEKIRGSFLGWDGQDLIDRSVTPPRRIPLTQIDALREYTGKTKGRHTGKGALIGTAAGLGLGLSGSVAALSTDCSTHEEPDDCEAMADAFAVLTPVVLTAAGALVGTVIGTAIPKKERITYVP